MMGVNVGTWNVRNSYLQGHEHYFAKRACDCVHFVDSHNYPYNVLYIVLISSTKCGHLSSLVGHANDIH